MANLCACDLTITGPKVELDRFKKALEEQDKDLLSKCCWLEKHNEFYGSVLKEDAFEWDDQISFPMDTKWSPPLQKLAVVSKDYPGLTFEIRWEEGGNQVYGTATILDGTCNSTDMTAHEYHSTYTEEYAEALYTLQHSSWEEAKKLDYFDDDGPLWGLLEPFFVRAIPVEELPLYINREWTTSEATEIFKKRFSEVKA